MHVIVWTVERPMWWWMQTKHFVEHSITFSSDALHVIGGVVVLLGAALLLRKPLSSIAPWLVVLVQIGLNEFIDIQFPQWPDPLMNYAESTKDLMLTMALPTLLLASARQFPQMWNHQAFASVGNPVEVQGFSGRRTGLPLSGRADMSRAPNPKGVRTLMATVERTEDVQDYFVRHAARFDGLYGGDNMATRIFDQLFRKPMYERYRLTIEALGEAKGKTYLDLGCGSGRYAINLARLGAKVVGLDFSAAMLELANTYARHEGVGSKAEFIQTDLNRWMDETGQHFDAAYAMGVFDYLDDPVATLRRMLEVADKAYLSIPAPEFPRAQLRRLRYKQQKCPVYFYTRRDTEELVAKAGGKILRIEPLGRRSGFWVEATKA